VLLELSLPIVVSAVFLLSLFFNIGLIISFWVNIASL